jgi:dienelactone hydrolase
MPAYRKFAIPLLLAIVTTSACLGETGILGHPLPTLAPTVVPIFTPSIIPATQTSPPTLTATIPTEATTPVFIPSPNPIRQTFTAEDGRQLVGYFYPSWKQNAPVVVLMHQYGSNQAIWQESPIIKWLQNWPVPLAVASPTPSAKGLLPIMPADLSFAVFTFDFRGHGESLPDDIIQDGFREHAEGFLMDAKAAYQTARQMPGVDPNKVIGFGTSIGADAVVDTCGEGCVGAFSISPGSWLNVNYSQAVRKLTAANKPVYCMYGTKDPPSPKTCLSVPPGESYKILAYVGKKHGMTFVILPRKMEAGFGDNLLAFLMEAIQ